MINLLNSNKKISILKLLTMAVLLFVFSSVLPIKVKATGASLSLTPETGTFQNSNTFLVKVIVSSGGSTINAAQSTILFSKDLLEVKSISKVNSIFTLWPEEPNFSNSKGEISFKGGVPSPGFNGTDDILTITFRAKKAGEAKVLFSGSEVLAADGRGTNILKSSKEANFSIIGADPGADKIPSSPEISSPTHPKQNFWYNNNNPEFQWKISSDIIEISYNLDRSPFSFPKTVNKNIESSKIFKEIDDGIWYFHLKMKNKFGWSKTSHYKIQIDTVPPNPFNISVDNQEDPTNPSPFLYFETKDELSGISHYEMKINQEDIFSLVIAEINPFSFSPHPPDSYQILVRAIDKAGNFEESLTSLDIESIPIPEISVYPKKYTAGTEAFYVSGTAPANLSVIIFFRKEGELTNEWKVESDENGDWSFRTNELFKSGDYLISAICKDNRGAISYPSPEYKVKVVLSGISIGRFIISCQTLFLILVVLIILIIGIFVYYITLKKRKIKKETQEAIKSLKNTFGKLRKKIIKKIEYFDSKPGLNSNEERLKDDLIKILEKSEKTIDKEIKDIKKELK